MITLTERAALALDELVVKSELPPGEGIKLVASGNQIGLLVTDIQEGDQVLQRAGETLLIVDRDIAEAVNGISITIDCEIEVVDGQAKTEFHFLRPAT
jgi:Fe-S cluster assembly iron-binding protein IscA